jgi:hypothetical protein
MVQPISFSGTRLPQALGHAQTSSGAQPGAHDDIRLIVRKAGSVDSVHFGSTTETDGEKKTETKEKAEAKKPEAKGLWNSFREKWYVFAAAAAVAVSTLLFPVAILITLPVAAAIAVGGLIWTAFDAGNPKKEAAATEASSEAGEAAKSEATTEDSTATPPQASAAPEAPPAPAVVETPKTTGAEPPAVVEAKTSESTLIDVQAKPTEPQAPATEASSEAGEEAKPEKTTEASPAPATEAETPAVVETTQTTGVEAPAAVVETTAPKSKIIDVSVNPETNSSVTPAPTDVSVTPDPKKSTN